MSLAVEGRRSRSSPGLVQRRELLARLQKAGDVALLSVVAPAGYGKTSLLRQWADADARACVWITLEERHNEPGCLIRELVAALRQLETNDRSPKGARRSRLGDIGERSVQAVLASLERRRTLIVLDDAHALNRAESMGLLASVLERMPSGSRLALASRTRPALQLGRMRVRGEVIELHAHDLAMDRDEARALLRGLGLELSATQAEALRERTEGWPAGLSLAALSARAQPDLGVAVSRFSGADHVVAGYLREELLARLTEDELVFLTGASALERLCGPLCDAVLGRSGSTRMLERLAQQSLLTPLDRAHEWHRCHRMLREMLLAQLRRNDPDSEAGLHRRASAWYAAYGDLDGSIAHAVAAGDAQRAGELLWRNLPRYLADGRGPMLQRWLQALPAPRIAAHPQLALAAAHCYLTLGDLPQADHWRRVAASALARSEAPSRAPSLTASELLIEASASQRGIVCMREDAARAHAMQAEDSPWRSLCCLLRGVGYYLTGERASAFTHLQEGVHLSAFDMPHVEALCLVHLALIAVEEADLERATELIDRAMSVSERRGLGEYPSSALTYAAAADIRSRTGRADEAKRYARKATRLLGMLSDFVVWHEAHAQIVLARAMVRLADVKAARALLAEASRRARRVPDATVFAAWLKDAWEQVEASASRALAGPAALTMAELRILRFLPTHLSFREIAGRLNVSTNTVKTQAHAVYGKLKASSRSEAVARACEIGLLVG